MKTMTLKLSNIPSKEIMPGYHGKLIHSENMSIAFWEVEKDAQVPEHSHMNEQIMHVLEGNFEFTLDGETDIYQPGDIVIIAPHKKHSGKALTPCKLMDVFSPTREEYK
jgi:quercetin dioxygenase-like cupin family protein